MRMPRKPFIVIMKNHSLPTGVICRNFNAFLEVEVLFSQPTALFSPYVDDVNSLLSTNLRGSFFSSAKVPAVDYKQPNKTQWQPSECLQLRVFGQPPVGDDITFSETGRTVPLKTPRQTAKESRGIGLKTCPEKTNWNFECFSWITEKGKKRHRTPTHQFIWGFLSLVFRSFFNCWWLGVILSQMKQIVI